MSKVMDIPLSQIEVVRNVRLDNGEKYQELVESMKNRGQLVPIQVYFTDPGWAVKYGHLRLQAAKDLGWNTIKATEVPIPASIMDALVDKAHENTARSDMSYMELAQVYEDLVEQGMKAQEVADLFGVSKTTVSVSRAILKASPKLRQAIEEERISPTAAEVLVFKDEETQEKLADAVISAKTARKAKAVVTTYERSGVIPTIEREVEETLFESDPLLETYRDQLQEAAHILRSIHPEWLDYPDDLPLEDEYRSLVTEVTRIREECNDTD